jgi:hypothetical protein
MMWGLVKANKEDLDVSWIYKMNESQKVVNYT